MKNLLHLHVIFLFTFFSFGQICQAQLKVTAKGTGQTTGHIATLEITNRGDEPVQLEPQVVYIPSSGKYQSYVGRIPGGQQVPPGGQVRVPVTGWCSDVHRPPVGEGTSMDPQTWIPVGPIVSEPGRPKPLVPTAPAITNPLAPPFSPNDIPKLQSAPGYSNERSPDPDGTTITYPGTDIPVTGTIEPDKNPRAFAPLVVEAVILIEDAADEVQNDPAITTPFAFDPVRERETLIQQTFWIYMATLTDDEYDKDDFAGNVYGQFEELTGQVVTALPKEEKKKVDQGVDAFWTAFQATGVEAKVIKKQPPPEEVQSPPAEADRNNCSLDTEIDGTPAKVDYAIAQTGTQRINEEARQSFIRAIEEIAGIALSDNAADTDSQINTPDLPASCWSAWAPTIVMGRANANAMNVNSANPTESAWSTEPIEAHADGNFRVTLRHTLGRDCRSTLIGVNVAKLKATTGMEATLGHIEFLRAINFVGEIAIDILIQKGKGTLKKLGKYLAEKAEDLAKDQIKEMVKNEIQRLSEQLEDKSPEEAEEFMDQLLREIQGDTEEEPDDTFADWMAEMLVEGEDFDPMDKIEGDILDNFDSPVDWSPIKTHTYALVQGQLDIWVEDNHALSRAGSGVSYRRTGLDEEEDEAVRGGGTKCQTARVTHATSGSITLRTAGKSDTYAGASGEGIISTGHGIASGVLESFNGMFVVAICECPDGIYYDTWNSTTIHSDDETMAGIWPKVFEDMLTRAVEAQFNTLGRADFRLPRNFVEDLKDRLNHAADEALEMILPCRE